MLFGNLNFSAGHPFQFTCNGLLNHVTLVFEWDLLCDRAHNSALQTNLSSLHRSLFRPHHNPSSLSSPFRPRTPSLWCRILPPILPFTTRPRPSPPPPVHRTHSPLRPRSLTTPQGGEAVRGAAPSPAPRRGGPTPGSRRGTTGGCTPTAGKAGTPVRPRRGREGGVAALLCDGGGEGGDYSGVGSARKGAGGGVRRDVSSRSLPAPLHAEQRDSAGRLPLGGHGARG
jgi:hypothetical protein